MKVKKNDNVLVITGKDVKKTGKVLVAMPKTNKIVVEGVNVQEKNRKARSAQETSQKIKKEGPIDASNVLVVCPVCGKATRVGYEIVDGKKVRICKKCKASLDVTVEKKAEAKKPAAKKTTTKKTTTKKADASAEAEVKEVKKTSTRKKVAKTEEATDAQA
jgi:large subunit ribosomal protein L24